ncbi:MAG: hypothetical protein AAGH40_00980 [Verrucomicrobiota bacterium]
MTLIPLKDVSLSIARYPLKLLGASFGRIVTIFRLQSGAVVIHSTGPFSDEDKEEIRKLGTVAAVVDVTNFHDTFAEIGRSAFPDARYFAPKRFPLAAKLNAESIEEGEAIWGKELLWLPLDGVPTLNEWVCYHPESKTLVVADLLFNCKPDDLVGKAFFALAGIRGWPGNGRLFRICVRDRKALETSIQKILAWDFDRLIVAHGDPIEDDAKAIFIRAIQRGFPWMNLEE